MALLVVVLWAVLFGTAMVGLLLVNRFFRSFREKHFQEWERLGMPSLVINNSPHSSLAVLNYLRRREYVALNDEEFTLQASRLWAFIRIYFLVFLVAVGLLIAFPLKQQS